MKRERTPRPGPGKAARPGRSKGFPFVVSIHDVAPSTARESAEWLAELDRRGVPATLLLIPGPYGGGPALADEPDLVSLVHRAIGRGHEPALHGYLHEGVPGGPYWRQAVNASLARGAGEFWSLTERQAMWRLRAGLDRLADADIGVVGFTPPGWLASRGTRVAVAALGFTYWTSQLAVHSLPGGPVRRMPALSHRAGGAGERTGAQLMMAATRAFAGSRRPFRVALHPADLRRPGLRRTTLEAIDLAIAAGGRPVTYQTLVTA